MVDLKLEKKCEIQPDQDKNNKTIVSVYKLACISSKNDLDF